MIIITIMLHSGIPAATVSSNFLEFQQRLSIVIPSNTWAIRIRAGRNLKLTFMKSILGPINLVLASFKLCDT